MSCQILNSGGCLGCRLLEEVNLKLSVVRDESTVKRTAGEPDEPAFQEFWREEAGAFGLDHGTETEESERDSEV